MVPAAVTVLVPIPEASAVLRSAEATAGAFGATGGIGGVRAKIAANTLRSGVKVPGRIPAGVPEAGGLVGLRLPGASTAAFPVGRVVAAVGARVLALATPGVTALPTHLYRLFD